MVEVWREGGEDAVGGWCSSGGGLARLAASHSDSLDNDDDERPSQLPH